jgi:uncharacterized protein Usg
MKGFLDFWERSIEGKLHSVQVTSAELIKSPQMRYARSCFTLH